MSLGASAHWRFRWALFGRAAAPCLFNIVVCCSLLTRATTPHSLLSTLPHEYHTVGTNGPNTLKIRFENCWNWPILLIPATVFHSNFEYELNTVRDRKLCKSAETHFNKIRDPSSSEFIVGRISAIWNHCAAPSSPLHNGENDSHKRQFLALGVRSQSWKLNNLSIFFSCQIDWCYKLLATIWQKFFLHK